MIGIVVRGPGVTWGGGVTVNDGDVSECGELSREELLEGFGSNWKFPGRGGCFLFYIVFVILSLSPRPKGGSLVFCPIIS